MFIQQRQITRWQCSMTWIAQRPSQTHFRSSPPTSPAPAWPKSAKPKPPTPLCPSAHQSPQLPNPPTKNTQNRDSFVFLLWRGILSRGWFCWDRAEHPRKRSLSAMSSGFIVGDLVFLCDFSICCKDLWNLRLALKSLTVDSFHCTKTHQQNSRFVHKYNEHTDCM